MLSQWFVFSVLAVTDQHLVFYNSNGDVTKYLVVYVQKRWCITLFESSSHRKPAFTRLHFWTSLFNILLKDTLTFCPQGSGMETMTFVRSAAATAHKTWPFKVTNSRWVSQICYKKKNKNLELSFMRFFFIKQNADTRECLQQVR